MRCDVVILKVGLFPPLLLLSWLPIGWLGLTEGGGSERAKVCVKGEPVRSGSSHALTDTSLFGFFTPHAPLDLNGT